jgi:hypothetical protein
MALTLAAAREALEKQEIKSAFALLEDATFQGALARACGEELSGPHDALD